MLTDSHAHLNDKQFENDLDEIVKKAKKNGVGYIIVNGYDLESSMKAIEIANTYENIYATVGIHPLDIDKFSESTIAELRTLAASDKVVAIGEIGLDYHYDKSKKEEQKEIFKLQLALAKELELPVTIHTRESINDTYDILKVTNNFGVMHCYSGSVEMAQKFIDIGYYISLAGPVTFKNAIVPKEVAKAVPLSRLLVETDCPYLTPHPNRGKRNDPSYVRLVVKEIAELRGIDIKEIESVTSTNVAELFKL
ncbi:MAG: TatD family hydrolase [Bacilli bacterium]